MSNFAPTSPATALFAGIRTVILACALASSLIANSSPEQLIYKKVGQQDLSLQIFQPNNRPQNGKRTAVMVFHGSGWGAGQPGNVYRFARHFMDLGYVAICVEYRLYKKGTVEVSDCVKDARSAMRYVRAHADELGISPSTIIACGYSAGGHLAVGTALFDGCDEPDEVSVEPCIPAAVILYSPVLDTSKEQGYGYSKIADQWLELSPLNRVRSNMPPVFICHSRDDKTVPYSGIERFADASKARGNDCVLLTLEGAEHGSALRDTAIFTQVMAATSGFLKERGLLPETKK